MAGRSLLRILFPVLPVLAVLVAVEIAATVSRTVRCPGETPGFAIPNPVYGWNRPAGATVRTHGCMGSAYEWSSVVTFNSHGLQDEEHAYARVPGVPRVLVLGDSVTEALQVPRRENFSSRLEAMFLEQGRRVEVINGGVSGFGTDNELLFYESEGRRYAPDVVLLVFNLQNDFAENSSTTVRRMYAGGPDHPKAGESIDDEGRVVLDPAGFVASVDAWERDPWRSWQPLAWLRYHSFFVRQLSNVLRSSARPVMPPQPSAYPAELGVYASPPDRDWIAARRITEGLLERLRSAVEQSSARLLVAVVPSRETVTPGRWNDMVAWFPALAVGTWDLEQPRRNLNEFLSAAKFRSVDTTATLRKEQADSGVAAFFAVDPHPNANGQKSIADSIFAPLRDMLDETSGEPPNRPSTRPSGQPHEDPPI